MITVKTVVWTINPNRRKEHSGGTLSTSGLIGAVQESTDLGIADAWDEVTAGTRTDKAAMNSSTLPGAPNPKTFIRLQVTQP